MAPVPSRAQGARVLLGVAAAHSYPSATPHVALWKSLDHGAAAAAPVTTVLLDPVAAAAGDGASLSFSDAPRTSASSPLPRPAPRLPPARPRPPRPLPPRPLPRFRCPGVVPRTLWM